MPNSQRRLDGLSTNGQDEQDFPGLTGLDGNTFVQMTQYPVNPA
jgi:hypothetical protein